MSRTGGTAESRSARLPAALLVAALVAAVCAACFDASEERAKQSEVDESWIWNRRSPGHEAHLGAGLKCNDCHQVGAEAALEVQSDKLCGKCHAEQHLHHGKTDSLDSAAVDYRQCTGCHRFAQDAKPAGLEPLGLGGSAGFSEPDDCLSCHQNAQADHGAVVVHAEQPCLTCHSPHKEPRIQAPDCTSCHEQVHLAHGKRSSDGRPGFEQCLDCHAPHSPAAVAGDACPRCHFEGEPLIPKTALFEGGHERCNGCHQSHDLRASAAASCQSCHEGHVALASTRVQAHQECTNCHQQHDVKRAAQNACANCHKAQHTDHPRAGGAAGACVTCHDPHPGGGAPAQAKPTACETCHREPHQERGHGAAGLACTSCHQPHEFRGHAAAPGLCASCHGAQASNVAHNKGHADCNSCHSGLPHHPAEGSLECARCHEDRAPANAKHGACTSCHEPHGGTLGKACSSCHVGEHKTAVAGHQDCTACHNPHSKDPRKVSGCEKCHADHAKNNPHTFGAGCQNCHRPHGASSGKTAPAGPTQPPSCASCHRPGTLGGLHLETGHNTCTSCHSPHDKNPRRNRASCLSCHQDRRDHQPQADNCASCHVFRGAASPP